MFSIILIPRLREKKFGVFEKGSLGIFAQDARLRWSPYSFWIMARLLVAKRATDGVSYYCV